MSEVIYTSADGSAQEGEDVRTGMTSTSLRKAIEDHLRYTLGRPTQLLEPQHYYHALALAVRDRMQKRWSDTTQTYLDLSRKVAVYLSAEFLMGPHLANNLLNLDLEDEARAALAELGQDFDSVVACEEEPGLGNGGLGRLAACYLESLATLQRPAIGYGIRYEFGIFDQEIRDGWQVEHTDNWLA
jgi:starch phosphorylase